MIYDLPYFSGIQDSGLQGMQAHQVDMYKIMFQNVGGKRGYGVSDLVFPVWKMDTHKHTVRASWNAWMV